MFHINNAIEHCCRICHATAPRGQIKPIRSDHAQFFMIPYNVREKICTKCMYKHNIYKGSTFDVVKINFGYHQDVAVPDVSFCSQENPCLYCKDQEDWTRVLNIANEKERRKAEKVFFMQKIESNSPTIALTQLQHKDEGYPGFFRIEYRAKKQDFIYCKPCHKLLAFTKSNAKSLFAHIPSVQHQSGSNSVGSSPMPSPRNDIVPDVEYREVTPTQLKHMREIVSESYVAKHSSYYLESAEFNDPLVRILDVLHFKMPENQTLTGSRQTLHRVAKQKSEKIKEAVKEEIKQAKQDGAFFVIMTDDGSLNNGTRENMRTWSVQWINSQGILCRRYLTSTDEDSKTAESIKKSLDKVKADFEIGNNYSLCTDGASNNIKLARLDGENGVPRQLNLCAPHGTNNAADCATSTTENQDRNFKTLNREISNFLSTASRKKFNQKFVNHDGWVKIKGLCDTRWDSLCLSLESIVKNYQILKDENVNHALIKNYTKELLQEYLDLIQPMKTMNKDLQTVSKTSGHLVATKYNSLWVKYLNYSVDVSKPPMLKLYARNLADELDQRIKIQRNQSRPGRPKTNRVNSDRVLQSAFFIANGFLTAFKENAKNIEHQQLINNRVDFYDEMIKDWAKTKSSETTVSRSTSFDGTQTALEFEIMQFANLSTRYVNEKNRLSLPQCLREFESDLNNNLDANSRFWSGDYAKEHLPNLRSEIMKLLPVPASTSMVEGTFSYANQIRTPKRSRLNTQNLNCYLTLTYCRLLNPHHYNL